ncbi:MAG: hypothetical protein GX111_13995 [Clostridiales bacterium]|jgi:hypothetical protein|nr:hypothetical protein [Clostridiales bacterium]
MPVPTADNDGSFAGDISHYFTLEESLTQENDVLFATYVGPHIDAINRVEYAFQINTRLKGQTETDTIYLSSDFYVEDSDAQASNSPFLKDEQYLLVLDRRRRF